MLVYPSASRNKSLLYPKYQCISQSAIIYHEYLFSLIIHFITLDNEPDSLQRVDDKLYDSH